MTDAGPTSAELFLRRAVAQALQHIPRAHPSGDGVAVARRTGATVMLAVRDDVRPTDQPFVESVLLGLAPVLTAAGLRTLSLYGHTDDVYWTLADHMERWHLTGMVMVSLHDGDPLPSLLATAGFPAVTIGRSQAGALPFVDADNVGGSRAAVRHLLGQGFGRIATITGPLNQQAMVDRLEGYRQGLREAGVPAERDVVVEGDGTPESGRRAMATLLEAHPDVDAVFVGSEIMTEGALQTLDVVGPPRRGGRPVRGGPGGIGLVSYDDGEVCRARDVTAVAQPVSGMGRAAGELLLEVLAGGDPGSRIVATELVVRASSARDPR
ncbi:MAG: substrate-binding domain-containing protein [Kineosporiaceae bacterium]